VHASSPLCNLQSHPGIDLRFFLAQPPDAETAARWLPALQVLHGWPDAVLVVTTKLAVLASSSKSWQLHCGLVLLSLDGILPQPDRCPALPTRQAELERHNDTVMLRGADTYKNLPNKTLRLLRYALAHPAGG